MSRTPIWAKPKTHQFWSKLFLRPVAYSWGAAIWQIIFATLVAYGFMGPPADAGVAMAVLAVGAVVMTIRPQMGAIEKIAWDLIACSLFFIELRSINSERDAPEAEVDRNRRQQDEAFKATMSRMESREDLAARFVVQLVHTFIMLSAKHNVNSYLACDHRDF